MKFVDEGIAGGGEKWRFANFNNVESTLEKILCRRHACFCEMEKWQVGATILTVLSSVSNDRQKMKTVFTRLSVFKTLIFTSTNPSSRDDNSEFRRV